MNRRKQLLEKAASAEAWLAAPPEGYTPEDVAAKAKEFDTVIVDINRLDALEAAKTDRNDSVRIFAVANRHDHREIEKACMASIGLYQQDGYAIPEKAAAELKPKSPRWRKARNAVRLPDHVAARVLRGMIPAAKEDTLIPILSGAGHGVDELYQPPILDIQSLPTEPTVLIDRVWKVPAVAGGFSVPVLRQARPNAVDPTENMYGNVKVTWLETETQEKPETEIMFDSVDLECHEAAAYTEISDTALRRAPVIEDWLTDMFRKACANEISSCIVAGTGIGQPTGFLTDAAILTVNRAVANQVSRADLIDLKYALYYYHLAGAIYLIHQTAAAYIEKQDETAGSPIFSESAANGLYDTLAALPYQLSNRCSTLGTKGDVIVCNPSTYALAVEQEVVVERSGHYKFRNNKTAFKVFFLADGKPIFPMTVAALDVPAAP